MSTVLFQTIRALSEGPPVSHGREEILSLDDLFQHAKPSPASASRGGPTTFRNKRELLKFVDESQYQERVNTVATGPDGGYTVPNSVGPVVDALFPFSAVLQSGANLVTLKSDTTLPRITGGVTAGWGSETAAIESSGVTFGGILFTPHRISATIELSQQLLSQSPELAEVAINRNIFSAIAYQLDIAALVGLGGGGEPLGLINNDAVSSTVTFGAAATLAKMCSFERKVADAFADGECTFIGSNATREKLRTVQKFASSSTVIWDDESEIIGRPSIATPAIGNTDNRLLYGNFAWFQIVMFGGARIIRDPFTRKKESVLELTIEMLADCGPLQPTAFVRSTDSAAQ